MWFDFCLLSVLFCFCQEDKTTGPLAAGQAEYNYPPNDDGLMFTIPNTLFVLGVKHSLIFETVISKNRGRRKRRPYQEIVFSCGCQQDYSELEKDMVRG